MAERRLGDADTLTAIFAASAHRYEDRIAIHDGPRSLTYAELDDRSTELACVLVERGVTAGMRVGLVLPRSADLIVAQLAVLKAGAAYVPLDPAYPTERLRYIIGNAACSHLIGRGDGTFENDLAETYPRIDPQARPHTRVALATVEPDSAAYVLHTSGSSGRPKGIEIRHDYVVRLLRSALPLFDFTPSDRWTLFHSPSFDVSVWEIWACLATGGTAYVIVPEIAESLFAFARLIAEERITVLHQVPSVFRYVAMAHEKQGRPKLSLRHLVFAGESIDLTHVRAFATQNPETNVRISNMYGLTESTIYSTHTFVDAEMLASDVVSPIGRVLDHQVLTIRDDVGRIVPIGESGEICIGNASIARGYLNEPELTRERFIVAGDGNERSIYLRTGDIGRELPGGTFAYLGRSDRQVKIHGIRIELAEIEATLRDLAMIDDAVVLAEPDAWGETTLVAFVVFTSTERNADSIAMQLREHLPRHMVPTQTYAIASVPLTVAGKLDRRALLESRSKASRLT